MPSWSLTSSIAMVHLDSEQFPKVRVFGSIGWVASGLFSIIFIKLLHIDFDGTNLPFYCGAAVSIIAVISNLTLPNTPPLAKGQKSSIIDAFGLRTIELMKDKNFAVFILFSFLSMIPFAMYFSFFSEFLLNINTKYISVTMNWGVLAEMGFLLLIPPSIKKFGLRKVMIFGLVALVIRYLSFYTGGLINQSWMYYIGILVHGLIFGFFYVGGQIYIDKKAPAELKSQAQGFIFLVTFGVGLLVGTFICSEIIHYYKNAAGYNWNAIWGITTIFSALLLLSFILLFQNKNVD
jgi:nucleoside transporter